MRILVIGGTGLLGGAFRDRPRSPEIVLVGSRDADVTQPQQVRSLVATHQPDCIILAAAYTDVDGCETNAERAMAVNCQGAANVAQVAKEAGSRLIYISTDYVFDGSKDGAREVDDRKNPISVYGRSKAEGEDRVLQLLPDGCVVRTSWLYGMGGKCFPDTILQLAQTRTELSVVADQRGCPTYARDLAQALLRLAEAGAKGVVHATNTGDCSWYEFSMEILRLAGRSGVRVQPITTDVSLRPARRPKNSVLSGHSLRQYGIAMRPWRDAVADYIGQWLAARAAQESLATAKGHGVDI